MQIDNMTENDKNSTFFCEPLVDPTTGIELPASLENGDILCGVAPYIKKFGFIKVNVYAVGFYVEASKAALELSNFKESTIEELDCQDFYDKLILGNFRKNWLLIYNRFVSKDQLQNGYREQMSDYVTASKNGPQALEDFTSFLRDTDQKKKFLQTINPNGMLELNFDGDEHKLVSKDMCNALLASSFDNKSGKPDGYAKYRQLITKNFVKCIFPDKSKEKTDQWRVTFKHGLKIRTSPSLEADVLGVLRLDTIIIGTQNGNWVQHEKGWSFIGQKSNIFLKPYVAPIVVEKTGWLYKFQPTAVGLLRSTWLPRWAHLKGDIFKYWEKSDQKLSNSHAKAIWNISDCIVREANEEVVKPKLGERTMLLYCFSITNKKKWKSIEIWTRE